MAGALEDFLAQQRQQQQPALTSAQTKQLGKLLGVKGGKDTISAKELTQGAKKYGASGKQFGDFFAAVAGAYGADRLKPSAGQSLISKGYTQEGGRFIKRDPLSGDILQKAKEAGYGEEDIRKYVAQTFAQKELGEGVGKFMGPGYTLNPNTGKFESIPAITISGGGDASSGSGTTATPSIPTVTSSGIFAGLNPNTMLGSTPFEMDYALNIDPYKIQAKSAERQANIQAGSAERQARISQQTSLQAAKIGQGTSLYNLIPSAF